MKIRIIWVKLPNGFPKICSTLRGFRIIVVRVTGALCQRFIEIFVGTGDLHPTYSGFRVACVRVIGVLIYLKYNRIKN